MAAQLANAVQRIADLDDEIAMLTADRSEHERHQSFKRQQALIGALRSSVAEGQMKYADLQRSHRGAIKRLRELDGTAPKARRRA